MVWWLSRDGEMVQRRQADPTEKGIHICQPYLRLKFTNWLTSILHYSLLAMLTLTSTCSSSLNSHGDEIIKRDLILVLTEEMAAGEVEKVFVSVMGLQRGVSFRWNQIP